MSPAKPAASTLDPIIGRNVRRRREELGASQDDLAKALRDRGWAIAGSAVATLERGGRGVRVNEMFFLADALNVSVAELLTTDELVSDVGRLPARGDQLVERLTRPPHGRQRPGTWADLQQLERDLQFSAPARAGRRGGRHSVGDEAQREAERYAAGRLGIPAPEVVRRSYARWGRTLTEERDARAAERTPEDASARSRATIRSHVTRALIVELERRRREEEAVERAQVIGRGLKDPAKKKTKTEKSKERT
jgi:transcriptional regulator with XRE-family HTH domain